MIGSLRYQICMDGAVRLQDKAGGDLLATHRGGILLHA